MSRADDVEKQIHSLERELKESTQIVQDMLVRQKKIEIELKSLRSNLSQIRKPKNITVTDHVVLRYAERHYHLPLEKIRQEIKEKVGKAETIGDLKFNGFVIRDNTVVTYTPTAEDKQSAL